MSTRYIFVTGGVVSSLGKGVIASTIGRLLQNRGYSITIQKFDPYINVDPGTLNPNEHGECYVTVDGYECDLDLGHYERFTDIHTTRHNSYTTGRIYLEVIERERHGGYGGHTVQVVPHITDAIKHNMLRMAPGADGEMQPIDPEPYDFVITEIGGTVGDIEGQPFLETIRQLKFEMPDQVIVIHLAYVPYIAAAGELKTKPTQHSVKQLQSYGIQPDCLVLRSEHPLSDGLRRKVAGFCNVRPEHVLQSPDVPSIYELPLYMRREGLDRAIMQLFGIAEERPLAPCADAWQRYIDLRKAASRVVNIGFVGKYPLQDAYKSITESLSIAGAYQGLKVKTHYIDCEKITDETAAAELAGMDGYIICPGFGDRGIEGKIAAARYLRTADLPTLGICLGMQIMAIEYARTVLGLADASSTEFCPATPHPVIDMMEEQKHQVQLGGTMRLGGYRCSLRPGSLAAEVYGEVQSSKSKVQSASEEAGGNNDHATITERHRHRYELNNAYAAALEEAGMACTGRNDKAGLVEIVEVPGRRFYIGSQFHPEYSSTVLHPHPLFTAFLKAATATAP